jgi:hypothetical protein
MNTFTFRTKLHILTHKNPSSELNPTVTSKNRLTLSNQLRGAQQPTTKQLGSLTQEVGAFSHRTNDQGAKSSLGVFCFFEIFNILKRIYITKITTYIFVFFVSFFGQRDHDKTVREKEKKRDRIFKTLKSAALRRPMVEGAFGGRPAAQAAAVAPSQ